MNQLAWFTYQQPCFKEGEKITTVSSDLPTYTGKYTFALTHNHVDIQNITLPPTKNILSALLQVG